MPIDIQVKAVIDQIEALASKAVPDAEWFNADDLAQVSFIDQSAAKMISVLPPDIVLALCKLAAKGLEIDSVISQLHADVMNIQCNESNANDEYSDRRTAYLHAHRDARHAAAELVSVAFSGD
jgi:hypothetical protein